MADDSHRSAIGSSFYWPMRLMPNERRQAMFAVYRYCRAVDDIADGPGTAEEKLERLQDWRDGLARLFERKDPGIAEIAGLSDALDRFALEKEPLEAMIRGMEMDAREEMRAPSMADLRNYCYCVAGSVGLSAVRIFGVPGQEGRRFAVALGEALQLTNILRDIGEDAEMDRLYLPNELLAEAGIAERTPREVARDPRLANVCDGLAEFAIERYRESLAALPADPRPLRPAMMMMGVYVRLLARLRRSGWRAQQERIRVPTPERLWVALRYLGPPASWPSSI